MTKESARKLSGIKRIALIASILAVGGLTFAICGSNPELGSRTSWLAAIVVGLGNGLAGALCLALAVAVYGVMYVTNGLIFDYQYPVWSDHKKVVHLAQIVVLALVSIGGGFLLAGPLPSGDRIADGPSLRAPLAFLGSLVFCQLLLFYICLWTPVTLRVIRRRLGRKGVSTEELARGRYMGISDPEKSSFKKMSAVEEDIGMLWLTPEAISYRGDTDEFRVEAGQFLAMTRKTDAGSLSALAGNVPVIIRFTGATGKERSVRFHPEDAWTLGQIKTASDTLAAAIEHWAASRPEPSTLPSVSEDR